MNGVARLGPVSIRWRSALPVDVFGPLVAGLPDVDPERPADLDLDLRLATRPAPRPRGESAFFADEIVGFTDDGSTRIWDGWSLLTVGKTDGRIRGEVHAESLRDPHRFSTLPLLMALSVGLRGLGLFQLHAAALRLDDFLVLVAGDSGAGKTTTALSLAVAGAAWGGDDTVFLHADGAGGAAIACVPRSFHLRAQTVRAFPSLEEHATLRPDGAEERWDLDPRRAFPDRGFLRAGTPDILVFPTVTTQPHTQTRRLSQAEAAGRLIPAGAFVVVDGIVGAPEQMALFGAMASAARAVSLELGGDALRDPSVVAACLRGER